MKTKIPNRITSIFEEGQLRGFFHSMAELQWLLLVLVILYFCIPTRPIDDPDALIAIMVSFAGFELLFRYLKVHARGSRWKLGIETLGMIGFITFTLWCTGMIESPLLNLYLLVIIACAITLGKVATLLEVMLIASCYLHMGYASHGMDIFTPETFTALMANFSPFLLVAYVTSMLAEDVHHAKREITVQSQTDELTGLLNMRAFAIILDKEIATADRYLHPVTIIMIDVDELKHINDQFGHGAGSRLLKTVAGSINDCVRASDVLARYGGDEFVVLMPHTGSKAARVAAERIREAIHTSSIIEVNGKRIAATASLGIASYPEGVDDVHDILEKADVALYKSKQSGRNRVTYYRKNFDVVRQLPEPNPAVIPHPSAAVS